MCEIRQSRGNIAVASSVHGGEHGRDPYARPGGLVVYSRDTGLGKSLRHIILLVVQSSAVHSTGHMRLGGPAKPDKHFTVNGIDWNPTR
jgi:hypothetical protein